MGDKSKTIVLYVGTSLILKGHLVTVFRMTSFSSEHPLHIHSIDSRVLLMVFNHRLLLALLNS